MVDLTPSSLSAIDQRWFGRRNGIKLFSIHTNTVNQLNPGLWAD